MNKTKNFCLGRGGMSKCESCIHLDTWMKLNDLPDPVRLSNQKDMVRINEDACALNNAKYYEPKENNKTFSPSIVIDGKIIKPPGWMYVLSFALAGCEWAIIEADTPEFRARIKEWMLEQKRLQVEEEITALEERLAKLRQQLIK